MAWQTQTAARSGRCRPSPCFAVVIPAHNAAKTLAETLSSVTAQRFADFEAVVVDDGSDDETARIAQSFCMADRRVRLMRQANAGVAAARNAGIAATTAPWIAPIDADDLWRPDYLAAIAAAIDGAPSVPTMVHAHCRVIDAQGRVIDSGNNAPVSGWAPWRIAYCNPVGNGSGMVFRRDAAASAPGSGGPYDERLHLAGLQGAEDNQLQIRLASAGPVAGTGLYLVGYRQGRETMSADLVRMTRSDQLARQLLHADSGFATPPVVARWVAGTHALRLAWGWWMQGRRPRALGWFLRALMLDWQGTAAAVIGRLRGKLRGCEIAGQDFMQLAPDAETSGSRLFLSVQKGRLPRIALIETAQAGPSASTAFNAIRQRAVT